MAVTEVLYTGDGSTTLFSFSFPYLEQTDVKASLNGTVTTAFTFVSSSTIQFNTAPAVGIAIRIYRDTNTDETVATFYSGSSIRSTDLNDNFNQVLYAVQESTNLVDDASQAAIDASTDADAAVTASTAALNAANAATATADNAQSTANTALSTANTALSTANTADANATTAISTANAAASAVSSVVLYTIVAAVANIPGSPANGDRIEVTNSTGIESFTPLTGLPAGFVGANGLAVRITYTTTGSTWQWVSYYPIDPENRYVPSTRTATESQTGLVELATAAETTTGTDATRAVHPAGLKVELDKKATIISPTFTGTPAAPTAAVGTNTTQLATTAFVNAEIANDVPAASESVAGRVELATAAETTAGTDDTKAVHPAGLKVELDKKAPTNSPTFTGTPAAPTATAGTNTTQIATTAFVVGENAGNAKLATSNTFTAAQLLPTGSVSAPSLSFSGDTNTGIYRPAADQVAISCGGTQEIWAGTTGVGFETTTAVSGNSGSDIGLFWDAANGRLSVAASNTDPGTFNRMGSDGAVIRIAQAGTIEGSIDVSGTTVSLTGGHISRWSQLPGLGHTPADTRPEILRGTVLTNLDEMCEWGDEDNEQLNKTQISSVDNDRNVAGIFSHWDDDDEEWRNDFVIAMTGDFIIRIGAGVTVERGDLLVSAGDGTARAQDDDLIRSSTVAKVISSIPSCVYPDGSYCVPCVLMAC